MRISDWRSDVCSSGLVKGAGSGIEEMWRGGGRGTSPPASSCCKGFPVSAGCGRSFPARGGGPPKVVEGHGRSSVTYKEDGKHLECPSNMLRWTPSPKGGGSATSAYQPKGSPQKPLFKQYLQ